MKTDEKKIERAGRGARRPRLSKFARNLWDEWRSRGWESERGRVVVAVSGGADSTALLLAFEELRRAGRITLSLTAAHFNHRLRGEESDADARWVKELCESHGFEIVMGGTDSKWRASRGNLEQAARRARYEFLDEAARASGAWAVLTAHTLDDQAETILLRLLRGSGGEGLTGMSAERQLVEGREEVRLLRPLVGWARRADTEEYCRERGVSYRHDEMNDDESFARVRVRRRLLPLLESFNPRAVEALARAGELLRDDNAALDHLAARLLEEAFDETSPGEMPLRVEVLASAAPSVRRRALRQWLTSCRGDLRRVELVHVRAIEKLLEGVRGGRVAELPGGGLVERRKGLLHFRRQAQRESRTRERPERRK